MLLKDALLWVVGGAGLYTGSVLINNFIVYKQIDYAEQMIDETRALWYKTMQICVESANFLKENDGVLVDSKTKNDEDIKPSIIHHVDRLKIIRSETKNNLENETKLIKMRLEIDSVYQGWHTNREIAEIHRKARESCGNAANAQHNIKSFMLRLSANARKRPP
jgi:hypothetical protein